jgi:nucleotidyltransferase substrate binding protein (TIGR01987 family)
MNEENLNIRWKQRFENYQKALATLQKVVKQTEEDSCGQDNQEMHEMALIQSFEFVFELGWKTMKDFLQAEGYKDSVSPRGVIKQCFANDYIQNGEIWLKALEDRNRTTHTYDENKIKQIVDNIREEYLEVFIDLDNFLKVK